MLEDEPEKRFDCKECLSHPYFMTSERGKYVFLEMAYIGNFKNELEKEYREIFKGKDNWEILINKDLMTWAKKGIKHQYKFNKVKDLVRLLGNFMKHDNEPNNKLPPGLLKTDQKPYDYVVENFPELIKWIGKCCVQQKRKLKDIERTAVKEQTMAANENKLEIEN